ncbi:MAG: hypothetical protein LBO21_01470 [Synergistaceae bacterium]|jgi:hypothetical protein|nr:hypothetical protein [Synergistaceae bacterium]
MTADYPPLEEIFPNLATEKPGTVSAGSLKEDAANDLTKRAVWFNDLELAGYHSVNGSKILCVFDRYDTAIAAIDSGRDSGKGSSIMAGLQSDLYLLFIREDEYGGAPRIGQALTVDGRKLYVQGSILYDGVHEITLKAGAVR